MKINVSPSGKPCEIYFDSTGNLFIKYDAQLYIIDITNDNDIILLKDDNYNELQNNDIICMPCAPKIEKLCLVSDNGNKNKNDEDDDDNKYYPENNSFLNVTDEEHTECYNNYDHEFIFSRVNQNVNINIVESDDYPALFDTLIYEGDPENGKLVFMSSCKENVKLMYRLLIYTTGEFYFRPTGEDIKKHKICFTDENQLILNIINNDGT